MYVVVFALKWRLFQTSVQPLVALNISARKSKSGFKHKLKPLMGVVEI